MHIMIRRLLLFFVMAMCMIDMTAGRGVSSFSRIQKFRKANRRAKRAQAGYEVGQGGAEELIMPGIEIAVSVIVEEMIGRSVNSLFMTDKARSAKKFARKMKWQARKAKFKKVTSKIKSGAKNLYKSVLKVVNRPFQRSVKHLKNHATKLKPPNPKLARIVSAKKTGTALKAVKKASLLTKGAKMLAKGSITAQVTEFAMIGMNIAMTGQCDAECKKRLMLNMIPSYALIKGLVDVGHMVWEYGANVVNKCQKSVYACTMAMNPIYFLGAGFISPPSENTIRQFGGGNLAVGLVVFVLFAPFTFWAAIVMEHFDLTGEREYTKKVKRMTEHNDAIKNDDIKHEINTLATKNIYGKENLLMKSIIPFKTLKTKLQDMATVFGQQNGFLNRPTETDRGYSIHPRGIKTGRLVYADETDLPPITGVIMTTYDFSDDTYESFDRNGETTNAPYETPLKFGYDRVYIEGANKRYENNFAIKQYSLEQAGEYCDASPMCMGFAWNKDNVYFYGVESMKNPNQISSPYPTYMYKRHMGYEQLFDKKFPTSAMTMQVINKNFDVMKTHCDERVWCMGFSTAVSTPTTHNMLVEPALVILESDETIRNTFLDADLQKETYLIKSRKTKEFILYNNNVPKPKGVINVVDYETFVEANDMWTPIKQKCLDDEYCIGYIKEIDSIINANGAVKVWYLKKLNNFDYGPSTDIYMKRPKPFYISAERLLSTEVNILHAGNEKYVSSQELLKFVGVIVYDVETKKFNIQKTFNTIRSENNGFIKFENMEGTRKTLTGNVQVGGVASSLFAGGSHWHPLHRYDTNDTAIQGCKDRKEERRKNLIDAGKRYYGGLTAREVRNPCTGEITRTTYEEIHQAWLNGRNQDCNDESEWSEQDMYVRFSYRIRNKLFGCHLQTNNNDDVRTHCWHCINTNQKDGLCNVVNPYDCHSMAKPGVWPYGFREQYIQCGAVCYRGKSGYSKEEALLTPTEVLLPLFQPIVEDAKYIRLDEDCSFQDNYHVKHSSGTCSNLLTTAGYLKKIDNNNLLKTSYPLEKIIISTNNINYRLSEGSASTITITPWQTIILSPPAICNVEQYNLVEGQCKLGWQLLAENAAPNCGPCPFGFTTTDGEDEECVPCYTEGLEEKIVTGIQNYGSGQIGFYKVNNVEYMFNGNKFDIRRDETEFDYFKPDMTTAQTNNNVNMAGRVFIIRGEMASLLHTMNPPQIQWGALSWSVSSGTLMCTGLPYSADADYHYACTTNQVITLYSTHTDITPRTWYTHGSNNLLAITYGENNDFGSVLEDSSIYAIDEDGTLHRLPYSKRVSDGLGGFQKEIFSDVVDTESYPLKDFAIDGGPDRFFIANSREEFEVGHVVYNNYIWFDVGNMYNIRYSVSGGNVFKVPTDSNDCPIYNEHTCKLNQPCSENTYPLSLSKNVDAYYSTGLSMDVSAMPYQILGDPNANQPIWHSNNDGWWWDYRAEKLNKEEKENLVETDGGNYIRWPRPCIVTNDNTWQPNSCDETDFGFISIPNNTLRSFDNHYVSDYGENFTWSMNRWPDTTRNRLVKPARGRYVTYEFVHKPSEIYDINGKYNKWKSRLKYDAGEALASDRFWPSETRNSAGFSTEVREMTPHFGKAHVSGSNFRETVNPYMIEDSMRRPRRPLTETEKGVFKKIFKVDATDSVGVEYFFPGEFQLMAAGESCSSGYEPVKSLADCRAYMNSEGITFNPEWHLRNEDIGNSERNTYYPCAFDIDSDGSELIQYTFFGSKTANIDTANMRVVCMKKQTHVFCNTGSSAFYTTQSSCEASCNRDCVKRKNDTFVCEDKVASETAQILNRDNLYQPDGWVGKTYSAVCSLTCPDGYEWKALSNEAPGHSGSGCYKKREALPGKTLALTPWTMFVERYFTWKDCEAACSINADCTAFRTRAQKTGRNSRLDLIRFKRKLTNPTFGMFKTALEADTGTCYLYNAKGTEYKASTDSSMKLYVKMDPEMSSEFAPQRKPGSTSPIPPLHTYTDRNGAIHNCAEGCVTCNNPHSCIQYHSDYTTELELTEWGIFPGYNAVERQVCVRRPPAGAEFNRFSTKPMPCNLGSVNPASESENYDIQTRKRWRNDGFYPDPCDINPCPTGSTCISIDTSLSSALRNSLFSAVLCQVDNTRDILETTSNLTQVLDNGEWVRQTSPTFIQQCHGHFSVYQGTDTSIFDSHESHKNYPINFKLVKDSKNMRCYHFPSTPAAAGTCIYACQENDISTVTGRRPWIHYLHNTLNTVDVDLYSNKGYIAQYNECKDCEAGKYAIDRYTCTDCPAGWSSKSGRASCQPCPVGKYNDEVGASSCKTCTGNTISNTIASTSCATVTGMVNPAHNGMYTQKSVKKNKPGNDLYIKTCSGNEVPCSVDADCPGAETCLNNLALRDRPNIPYDASTPHSEDVSLNIPYFPTRMFIQTDGTSLNPKTYSSNSQEIDFTFKDIFITHAAGLGHTQDSIVSGWSAGSATNISEPKSSLLQRVNFANYQSPNQDADVGLFTMIDTRAGEDDLDACYALTKKDRIPRVLINHKCEPTLETEKNAFKGEFMSACTEISKAETYMYGLRPRTIESNNDCAIRLTENECNMHAIFISADFISIESTRYVRGCLQHGNKIYFNDITTESSNATGTYICGEIIDDTRVCKENAPSLTQEQCADYATSVMNATLNTIEAFATYKKGCVIVDDIIYYNTHASGGDEGQAICNGKHAFEFVSDDENMLNRCIDACKLHNSEYYSTGQLSSIGPCEEAYIYGNKCVFTTGNCLGAVSPSELEGKSGVDYELVPQHKSAQICDTRTDQTSCLSGCESNINSVECTCEWERNKCIPRTFTARECAALCATREECVRFLRVDSCKSGSTDINGCCYETLNVNQVGTGSDYVTMIEEDGFPTAESRIENIKSKTQCEKKCQSTYWCVSYKHVQSSNTCELSTKTSPDVEEVFVSDFSSPMRQYYTIENACANICRLKGCHSYTVGDRSDLLMGSTCYLHYNNRGTELEDMETTTCKRMPIVRKRSKSEKKNYWGATYSQDSSLTTLENRRKKFETTIGTTLADTRGTGFRGICEGKTTAECMNSLQLHNDSPNNVEAKLLQVGRPTRAQIDTIIRALGRYQRNIDEENKDGFDVSKLDTTKNICNEKNVQDFMDKYGIPYEGKIDSDGNDVLYTGLEQIDTIWDGFMQVAGTCFITAGYCDNMDIKFKVDTTRLTQGVTLDEITGDVSLLKCAQLCDVDTTCTHFEYKAPSKDENHKCFKNPGGIDAAALLRRLVVEPSGVETTFTTVENCFAHAQNESKPCYAIMNNNCFATDECNHPEAFEVSSDQAKQAMRACIGQDECKGIAHFEYSELKEQDTACSEATKPTFADCGHNYLSPTFGYFRQLYGIKNYNQKYTGRLHRQHYSPQNVKNVEATCMTKSDQETCDGDCLWEDNRCKALAYAKHIYGFTYGTDGLAEEPTTEVVSVENDCQYIANELDMPFSNAAITHTIEETKKCKTASGTSEDMVVDGTPLQFDAVILGGNSTESGNTDECDNSTTTVEQLPNGFYYCKGCTAEGTYVPSGTIAKLSGTQTNGEGGDTITLTENACGIPARQEATYQINPNCSTGLQNFLEAFDINNRVSGVHRHVNKYPDPYAFAIMTAPNADCANDQYYSLGNYFDKQSTDLTGSDWTIVSTHPNGYQYECGQKFAVYTGSDCPSSPCHETQYICDGDADNRDNFCLLTGTYNGDGNIDKEYFTVHNFPGGSTPDEFKKCLIADFPTCNAEQYTVPGGGGRRLNEPQEDCSACATEPQNCPAACTSGGPDCSGCPGPENCPSECETGGEGDGPPQGGEGDGPPQGGEGGEGGGPSAACTPGQTVDYSAFTNIYDPNPNCNTFETLISYHTNFDTWGSGGQETVTASGTKFCWWDTLLDNERIVWSGSISDGIAGALNIFTQSLDSPDARYMKVWKSYGAERNNEIYWGGDLSTRDANLQCVRNKYTVLAHNKTKYKGTTDITSTKITMSALDAAKTERIRFGHNPQHYGYVFNGVVHRRFRDLVPYLSWSGNLRTARRTTTQNAKIAKCKRQCSRYLRTIIRTPFTSALDNNNFFRGLDNTALYHSDYYIGRLCSIKTSITASTAVIQLPNNGQYVSGCIFNFAPDTVINSPVSVTYEGDYRLGTTTTGHYFGNKLTFGTDFNIYDGYDSLSGVIRRKDIIQPDSTDYSLADFEGNHHDYCFSLICGDIPADAYISDITVHVDTTDTLYVSRDYICNNNPYFTMTDIKYNTGSVHDITCDWRTSVDKQKIFIHETDTGILEWEKSTTDNSVQDCGSNNKFAWVHEHYGFSSPQSSSRCRHTTTTMERSAIAEQVSRFDFPTPLSENQLCKKWLCRTSQSYTLDASEGTSRNSSDICDKATFSLASMTYVTVLDRYSWYDVSGGGVEHMVCKYTMPTQQKMVLTHKSNNLNSLNVPRIQENYISTVNPGITVDDTLKMLKFADYTLYFNFDRETHLPRSDPQNQVLEEVPEETEYGQMEWNIPLSNAKYFCKSGAPFYKLMYANSREELSTGKLLNWNSTSTQFELLDPNTYFPYEMMLDVAKSLDSSRLVDCGREPNLIQNGKICTACATGKYSLIGVDQCVDCPAGRTRVGSQVHCEYCDIGEYINANKECASCPAGKYKDDGESDICVNCPTGFNSESGSDFCYRTNTCDSGLIYQSKLTCQSSSRRRLQARPRRRLAVSEQSCYDQGKTDSDENGICDEDEIHVCFDASACNTFTGEETDVMVGDNCTFPEAYKNCDGTCLNDVNVDGQCDETQPDLFACSISTACNYDNNASLIPNEGVCTMPLPFRNCVGNCISNTSEQTLCPEEVGCPDIDACNFNENATVGIASNEALCTYAALYKDCAGNCLNNANNNNICDELEGCPNENACNYKETAENTTANNALCAIPKNYQTCSDGAVQCINPRNNTQNCEEEYDCNDISACNYNAEADFEDTNKCVYPESHRNCDQTCKNDDDADGVCDESATCTDIGTCYTTFKACADDSTNCANATNAVVDCTVRDTLYRLLCCNSSSPNTCENMPSCGTDICTATYSANTTLWANYLPADCEYTVSDVTTCNCPNPMKTVRYDITQLPLRGGNCAYNDGDTEEVMCECGSEHADFFTNCTKMRTYISNSCTDRCSDFCITVQGTYASEC